jgi:purine-nucleoside phosphorylase
MSQDLDRFEETRRAADEIRKRCLLVPNVGVILGSGLGAFADNLDDAVAIPYGEIPGWPVSSVVGHSGRFVVGASNGVAVAALQGRAHLYEGREMADVVFGIRVLHQLGVRKVVVTNAAGAVNKSFPAGSLMLISDHINLMARNPLIGPNDDRIGPRFPDMSDAYAKAFRELAKKEAAALGISLSEGVYAGLLGPSYETPAEIRMLRAIGADAVGMSTVPEVIAAAHAGMKVLGISCLTNMAAGVLDQKLNHEEVLAAGKAIANDLLALLRAVLPTLAKA